VLRADPRIASQPGNAAARMAACSLLVSADKRLIPDVASLIRATIALPDLSVMDSGPAPSARPGMMRACYDRLCIRTFSNP